MKKLFIYTITAISIISCSKDRLSASGDKITETRSPADFTGINTSGSTPVHISYGTEYKVMLKGSNNLIPHFKTNTINGTLYLGYEKASVQHDDVEAFVTLPQISKVSVSGDSDVDITGQFPTIETFKLSISGSGEVDVHTTLNASQTNISISGSGEADLKKLATKNADIDISGSGEVEISVEENLKARISGSGKIYYLGSPQIDSQISGSGKLIKR